MKSNLALLMTALSVVSVCTPSWAGHNSAIDRGIEGYNARKYAAAITDLESAIGADPNNARAHYYLALSYQALRRFDDAQREYRWNYDHKKDRDLAMKSWQGLNALAAARRTTAASPQGSVAVVQSPTTPVGITFKAEASKGPILAPPVYDKPANINMKWTPGCVRHGGGG